MKYGYNHRVSFSEVDKDLYMTLPMVLTHFQDCSTFHSEDVGVGVEYLNKAHCAWILSSWYVTVERFPKMFENIKVSTWACGFKSGFMGIRNFTIEDEEGNVIIAALTNWVYMDVLAGRPVRVPADEIEAYGSDEPYPMPPVSRKIQMPEGGIAFEPFAVKKSDIDWNHHVNNEKYVLMAMEYLPEGFEVKKMRAEYKKSAVLGDTIYPVIVESEEKTVVSLNNEEGNVFAIVEFYA